MAELEQGQNKKKQTPQNSFCHNSCQDLDVRDLEMRHPLCGLDAAQIHCYR